MDPSQSIDDILDATIGCSDNSSLITDIQSATPVLSGSSPAPQPDQSQSTKRQKDDNFLSSPLCSSLLLELPPSPNNAPPLSSTPAPLPPPPICTTPPSSSLSRKRRSEVPAFDPADWLESLTSGLHPLTPPAAPFLESDFGLDSDLNVNRVLDLMVEQW
ncbi:myocardin-like isoform X2 [Labeo rohita]|uniref:Myocardin-like isoform X2 n=2 Tax=Labeo rohita TaxID=84645 RepID=A0A498NX47_LABRO|nr:myocardin-like isoform X2 [Labeo rohita]